MTFKQNSLFLRQFLFFDLLLAAASVPFMLNRAGAGEWSPVLMTGLCVLLVTVLTFRTWRSDPQITMDDQGVRCTRGQTELWSFSWSQVAQVRKISHLRSAAVQLIPVKEPTRDLHTPQDTPFYGFQLSRTAKQALNEYCPGLRK